MEKKRLLKGAEAIGEAAIQSGCTRFYGYPVPTQSDLMEYLIQEESKGRGLTVFQSEDPLSSFFMAYGATIAGARVLTAVNTIDLPDALRAASYFSAANLPLVCAIFTQSGPGSGNIYPEQSHTLATLFGTRMGDGFAPILTPSTPTDCAVLTHRAFRLSETYQIPAFVLIDTACAQLVETVDFSTLGIRRISENRPGILERVEKNPTRITTLALDIDKMEEKKETLREKETAFITAEEGTFHLWGEQKETVIIAFGIAAIQVKRALDALFHEGFSATLFEPTSLYPFPSKALQTLLAETARLFIIDMSHGQLETVLSPYLPDSIPKHVFTATGGTVPRVEQLKLWIHDTLQST